jgi:hypothetical protein
LVLALEKCWEWWYLVIDLAPWKETHLVLWLGKQTEIRWDWHLEQRLAWNSENWLVHPSKNLWAQVMWADQFVPALEAWWVQAWVQETIHGSMLHQSKESQQSL